MTVLNRSYYPINNITIMKEEPEITYPSNIEGLEDARLFYFNSSCFMMSVSSRRRKAQSLNSMFVLIVFCEN